MKLSVPKSPVSLNTGLPVTLGLMIWEGCFILGGNLIEAVRVYHEFVAEVTELIGPGDLAPEPYIEEPFSWGTTDGHPPHEQLKLF